MGLMTNIPDPDCLECDGVGWYEGGTAIQTRCTCLRLTTMILAEEKVVNGTYKDWKELYDSLKNGDVVFEGK